MVSIWSRSPLAPKRRWGATAAALLGAMYAVASAFGVTYAVCVTGGCALFKGVSVAGVSLWWWGAACFLAIGAMAALRFVKAARLLAAVALALDVVLLGVLALTAPCLTCLIGGALFLATFVALTPLVAEWARILVLGWALLLTPNIFNAIQDSLRPWAVNTTKDVAVQFYFMPSCPACKDMAKELADLPPPLVAYYPVAVTQRDRGLVAALEARLLAGEPMPTDLGAFFDTAEPAPVDFGLRVNLFRNRLALMAMRSQSIPVLLVKGNPKALRLENALLSSAPESSTAAPAMTESPGPHATPPPGGLFGGADGGEYGACTPGPVPCPETNASLPHAVTPATP